MKARALIQKRVQQALGKHVEFNEVLRYEISKLIAVTLQRRLPNSAAYMERQKMAVGPFLFPLWYAIAHQNTLALGSFTATMRLGWAQLLQDYL